MEQTNYSRIWTQIAPFLKEQMEALSSSLQERGIAPLIADPVTLETDTEDFYASLILRYPSMSMPALSVSLKLYDFEDEERVCIQLCVDSLEVTALGVDLSSPVFLDSALGISQELPSDVEELHRQANYLMGIGSPCESIWNNVQSWVQMSGLAVELSRRAMAGQEPSSIVKIEKTLGDLGYTLDRSADTRSEATWMSGPAAGFRYPVLTTGIIEKDTRKSFAHFESRRDSKFDQLQELRKSGTLFAVVNGHILDL